MRRAVLEILQCTRCHRGRLTTEIAGTQVLFGPLRCTACDARFPVGEGVADLWLPHAAQSGLQRGLDHPAVARSYEGAVRPLLQLLLARRYVDADSELLIYRALLGPAQGPLLDLGCGTGLFARRLAHVEGIGPVVAMDISRPMIEEAAAQAREAGVMVDFVRAEAPSLPFRSSSLAGVLHASSLHLVEDARPLFRELLRVLRPGGRYVASSYLPPPRPLAWAQQRLGVFARTEAELRAGLTEAGLVRFERMRLGPFIVVKAERPE